MQALVDVALPVFAIILCGYGVGRAGVLGDHGTEALNSFVYWVALPPLLFLSMARTDPANIFVWEFVVPYIAIMAVGFVLVMVLVMLLFRRSFSEATMAGMSGIFGNTGYMGIPLVLTAFGEAAVLPAAIATVVNSALVVGIVAMMLEASLHSGLGAVRIARQVFIALCRNPLVVSSVLGIAWAFTGLSLPGPAVTFAEIVGASAGPCALFAIGLFLVGKPIAESFGEVSLVLLVKLVAMPLVAIALLPFLPGLDPLWAKVLVLKCALPLGANVFVMAMRYNVYVLASSSATLLSTLLSVVTVSVLLAWMGL